MRLRSLVLIRLCAAGLCAAGLAGCAGGAQAEPGRTPPRTAIEAYLVQVEPIRLAVNRLLNQADPIIAAYHDHRVWPAAAGVRMGKLERLFAAYTVKVAAIEPGTAQLRVLHAAYAHTYVLEDAYLSALANGLAQHKLDRLPNTQAAQRAAIIGWRTGLTVLADRTGIDLPADLQQAGRGEIAPSPGVS